MRLLPVHDRNAQFLSDATRIWEQSVRATHHFLTDADIEKIKQFVPEALRSVPSLTQAINDDGSLCGFIGTADRRIEMLFIAPHLRGQGLGKQLLNHAVHYNGVKEVTVNEQNPQAVGFYEHMGFRTYKRSAVDEQGGPFPLLYMRLDHSTSIHHKSSIGNSS